MNPGPPSSPSAVLRDVVVAGRRADVRMAAGRIVALAPSLRPRPDDAVVDAGGRIVRVGLHDHHLHLRALGAAPRSVAVGPADLDGDTFVARLRDAASGVPAGGWLRAVGYHDSVAGPLDRRRLDESVSGVPVRVQYRSGELWVLNSAALAAVEIEEAVGPGVERDDDGRPTGRLWRLDRWLEERWPSPPVEDLSTMSRRAAVWGVTGLTDASPGRSDDETSSLEAAVDDGRIVQRLHLMVRPGAAPRTGNPRGRFSTGPVKVLLDDAALPHLEALASLIRAAHATGRGVAIHCVTRVQLVLAAVALREAGPSGFDRIEHGAVIPAELVDELRRLRVTVVTQPNFVAERGDAYLAEVDERELGDLWRARSLAAASVRVAIGTDAPFGGADPWDAVRAAVDRRTVSGDVLGADEAVSRETALGWLSGWAQEPWRPRTVAVGQPADLILTEESVGGSGDGGGPTVAATVVDGVLVHGQGLMV